MQGIVPNNQSILLPLIEKQLKTKDKALIQAWVELQGGSYTTDIGKCSHLVIVEPKGVSFATHIACLPSTWLSIEQLKYNQAYNNKSTKIVSLLWFNSCVKANRCVDESQYYVIPTTRYACPQSIYHSCATVVVHHLKM